LTSPPIDACLDRLLAQHGVGEVERCDEMEQILCQGERGSVLRSPGADNPQAAAARVADVYRPEDKSGRRGTLRPLTKSASSRAKLAVRTDRVRTGELRTLGWFGTAALALGGATRACSCRGTSVNLRRTAGAREVGGGLRPPVLIRIESSS
jgi:hypothetical protein